MKDSIGQNRINTIAMKTKILTLLCLTLVLGLCAEAQVPDTLDPASIYQQFKNQSLSDYEAFKEQAYREFEAFLAETWTEYECVAGRGTAYSQAKPKNIEAMKVEAGESGTEVPFIISDKPATWQPMSYKPSVQTDHPDAINVKFYGRELTFHFPKELRITPKGYKEKDVANYYATMRENDPKQALQKEVSEAVKGMGLNEWGHFVLYRTIADKVLKRSDDCVLFCFYMLRSQGFKARIGRGHDSGQLMLLLALDNSKEVYSLPFFRFNGEKYYTVLGGQKGEDAYSYNEKADDKGLHEVGLDFYQTLNIAPCDKQRTLSIPKTEITLQLPYSNSHLRYYDEMPMTVFPIYFKTGVSIEAQKVLAETFSELGKHNDKVQLVDLILGFVQNAFSYKIDEEQFGKEKYFFPEEVIGYRYSDCEDRAALFAWMVRTYVGYDVIGVLYPDHLATAVCLGTDAMTQGKTLLHHGKRYVICDPTCPNAPMGTVMPKLEKTAYEIVEIN